MVISFFFPFPLLLFVLHFCHHTREPLPEPLHEPEEKGYDSISCIGKSFKPSATNFCHEGVLRITRLNGAQFQLWDSFPMLVFPFSSVLCVVSSLLKLSYNF
jgi:hypothetical protein